MVGDAGNILSPVQQRQLTVLQATARASDAVQLRLASGREVNSAFDDPESFFAAKKLDFEARDLTRLLDGINKSIETIKHVQNALAAIQEILDTAEAFLLEFQQNLLNGEVELTETLDTSFFIPFDNVADFIPYSPPQDNGTAALIEAGFGVEFDNNAWKRYLVNYNITASTTLEFDFRSTNIPEIAAIGFDNDNNFMNGNTQFFLYGTQLGGITYSAPIPTFQYDGSGDWVHVEIPVGSFFTGNFSHLTFITDDDGGGDDGEAQYRNVVIHEGDYVFGATTLSVSDTYERRYAAILDQIDLLVQDATYRGTNLLADDDLTTFFNARRTSDLLTDGIDATSDALGLERLDFTTEEAVEEKITQVRAAREFLRSYAGSLATDFDVLNDRLRFSNAQINVMQEGRDKLTLTDQNRDGAQLLALQTRQSIQTSVLTVNTASIADFLI